MKNRKKNDVLTIQLYLKKITESTSENITTIFKNFKTQFRLNNVKSITTDNAANMTCDVRQFFENDDTRCYCHSRIFYFS